MLKRFMALFDGLPRAYGVYVVDAPLIPGSKRKGEARTVQGAVDEALWARHFNGEIQLGIVPIRDDATCVFGAIDVDDYKVDLKALEARIQKAKLPLIMCRSKSGGAHLYAFFKQPVAATGCRELLAGWAATLGYSNVEIFPKQDILINTSDTGNWLNLPYSNGALTERYALVNNTPLSPADFLAVAESRLIGPEIFESSDDQPELLENGPPCLITLANQGLPEGTRNNALFSLGIYCQKRWPAEWEDHIGAMNAAYLSPPLQQDEVTGLIKQLKKKEYNYRCKDQPLVSVCQRTMCLKRKYGVGSDDYQQMFGPAMENVLRLETEPPVYFADYIGRRITFNAKHLISQQAMRQLLIEQANTQLQPMKPKLFLKWTGHLIQTAAIVEAPPEVSAVQATVSYLEDYALSLWPAHSWAEVVAGGVLEDHHRMYFRPHKFLQVLNKERRTNLTVSELYQSLIRIDCKSENREINSKTYTVWSVPAFKREAERNEEL